MCGFGGRVWKGGRGTLGRTGSDAMNSERSRYVSPQEGGPSTPRARGLAGSPMSRDVGAGHSLSPACPASTRSSRGDQNMEEKCPPDPHPTFLHVLRSLGRLLQACPESPP